MRTGIEETLAPVDAVALALRLIDPELVFHVIPEDDCGPHREGSDCPCQPIVRLEGPNGALVIHQAWDEREVDLR